MTIAMIGLMSLALLGCQPTRLRTPTYGSNVRVNGTRNFPDPSVLAAAGNFYAFSTNSTGSGNPTNIGIVTSSNKHDWLNPYTGSDTAGDALPTPPTWAREVSQGGGFWGPTVTRLGGRYVMHFAARHKSVSSTRPGWCIGTALSSTPEGPYTASSRPLFCRVTARLSRSSPVTAGPATNQGSIDPQVFTAGGKVFLHFKANDTPNQLWGIRLSADGRRVVGRAVSMVSMAEKANVWEYARTQGFTVLENPAMDYNPNARAIGYPYYLYYSGGDWKTASYATGVAACRGPLGPCVRVTTKPWLSSRGSAVGPGGLSHFRVGNSRWVAYHSYERGAAKNGRRLHIEPLGYQGLTATLLSRRPTGSIHVTSTVPTTVELSGRAVDPDTGAPVLVVVRENKVPLARTYSDSDGNWSVVLNNVSAETHRYCVLLGDDNGLTPKTLPCKTVDASGVLTATASEPAPEQQPAPTPTTIPPGTSTTTTVLTVGSDDDEDGGAG